MFFYFIVYIIINNIYVFNAEIINKIYNYFNNYLIIDQNRNKFNIFIFVIYFFKTLHLLTYFVLIIKVLTYI